MATTKTGGSSKSTKILNAVRSQASDYYRENTNVATTKNVAFESSAIGGDKRLFNEFYDAVNTLGIIKWSSPSWKDPLDQVFNQGELNRGDSIENTFVDLVEEKMYSLNDGEKLFAYDPPDMTSLYSKINRRSKYKVSKSIPLVKQILLNGSQTSPEDALNKITQNLYTSNERDNTKYAKRLLSRAIERGGVIFKEVGDVIGDPAAMSKFLTTIRADYSNIQWINPEPEDPKYNVMGVDNPAQDVVTVVPNNYKAAIDVNTLAGAFNIGKTDLMGKVVNVNNLQNNNVVAMMMDPRFAQIYNVLDDGESFFNPETLISNEYLHIWKLYTYVKFFNCVVYVKKLPDSSVFNQMYTQQSGSWITSTTKDSAIKMLPLYPDQVQGEKLTVSVSVDSPAGFVNPDVHVFTSGSDSEAADITSVPYDGVTPLLIKVDQDNQDALKEDAYQGTLHVKLTTEGEKPEDAPVREYTTDITLVNPGPDNY